MKRVLKKQILRSTTGTKSRDSIVSRLEIYITSFQKRKKWRLTSSIPGIWSKINRRLSTSLSKFCSRRKRNLLRHICRRSHEKSLLITRTSPLHRKQANIGVLGHSCTLKQFFHRLSNIFKSLNIFTRGQFCFYAWQCFLEEIFHIRGDDFVFRCIQLVFGILLKIVLIHFGSLYAFTKNSIEFRQNLQIKLNPTHPTVRPNVKSKNYPRLCLDFDRLQE